jgi:two-component system, LytTR family, sensor kinase
MDALEDISNPRLPIKLLFDEAKRPFSFFVHYFIPRLFHYIFLYGAFLFLNFALVPKLIEKRDLLKNTVVPILVFLLGGLVVGAKDIFLRNYLFNIYPSEGRAYSIIFQNSFLYTALLVVIFVLYSVIKYICLYLLSRSDFYQAKYKFTTSQGLAAFGLWMMSSFLLVIGGAERTIIFGWGIIGPSAILLYWYSFYSLIPLALRKKYPFTAYSGKVVIVLIIVYLPLSLLLLLLTQDEDTAFSLSSLNSVFQLLITVPVSWWAFKQHIKGMEELSVLKMKLGQSNASFDFLRSQINPHFLFNALNTLYGTALQEKAERTGEGIEKLSSMMRFMLQENLQTRIPLHREIEYLNDYIGIQKLRTDNNPIITIKVAIEPSVNNVQVAPMLLVPFVENAFKHGISFREPSQINISLEVRHNTIYFDVHNSKHKRQSNDPERDKSGIGLENVKQRLQLLYAGSHELVIRETPKDFFVHLTLQT